MSSSKQVVRINKKSIDLTLDESLVEWDETDAFLVSVSSCKSFKKKATNIYSEFHLYGDDAKVETRTLTMNLPNLLDEYRGGEMSLVWVDDFNWGEDNKGFDHSGWLLQLGDNWIFTCYPKIIEEFIAHIGKQHEI